MEMIPVDSSSIEAFGYDPSLGDLVIIFKRGGRRRYTYHSVSTVEFAEFLSAPSKGSFIATEIKPNKRFS